MSAVAENDALLLSERSLEIVKALLRQFAPQHQAFAFGSRVIRSAQDRQRVKPHSDLDLALVGAPLPLNQMFELREAFSESDLSMRVDIVNAADLPQGWHIRAWPL